MLQLTFTFRSNPSSIKLQPGLSLLTSLRFPSFYGSRGLHVESIKKQNPNLN